MIDFKKKDFYTIEDLIKIVEILRDPVDGCEWDKVQTHESIRQNFIEEAYEAVDAIDKKDEELLKEELGDVLLQVLLHSRFEEEKGTFTFDEVVNGLAQKLVLRHPHVFKNEDIKGVDNILNKWEEIKNSSHGHNTVSQTLNAVPKSFPALMYAQKVQKRVGAGGLPVRNQKEEIENIKNIISDMENEVDNNGVSEDNLFKLLFASVNIARQGKMDAEEVLSLKSYKFVEIFNIFEDLALQNGVVFDTINFALLKKLWMQAEELVEKK